MKDFTFLQKVSIIDGFYKGHKGIVMNRQGAFSGYYTHTAASYEVEIGYEDSNYDTIKIKVWVSEDNLELAKESTSESNS